MVNSLGGAIIAIRKRLKSNRNNFSQMIGCSQVNLSLFEKDKKLPSLKLLYKISDISNTTVSEIFRSFEKSTIEKNVPDGDKIKLARKNAGITQMSLASTVDVSDTYISLIEKGRKIASIKLAKKIAEATKVELKKLLK